VSIPTVPAARPRTPHAPDVILMRSAAEQKDLCFDDHRIGLTLHQLDQVMDGKFQPFIDGLITHFSAEKMKEQAAVTT